MFLHQDHHDTGQCWDAGKSWGGGALGGGCGRGRQVDTGREAYCCVVVDGTRNDSSLVFSPHALNARS